jgi:methionyl-tRNA synthetase
MYGGCELMMTDYSEEEMNVNYRILSDQIGNLLSRISSPRILGKMGPFSLEDRDPMFDAQLTDLRDVVCAHMEEYAVSKSCDSILEVIASVSHRPRNLSTGSIQDLKSGTGERGSG